LKKKIELLFAFKISQNHHGQFLYSPNFLNEDYRLDNQPSYNFLLIGFTKAIKATLEAFEL
jgi:hypothetical protein